MLQPRKTKHRKAFRNRKGLCGQATRGSTLAFGSYGIKAMSGVEINSRQIEAARKAINNYLSRQGKLWIRIFPHKPITKKAAEVPMGSGKGSIDSYVVEVKKGLILFELDGVSEQDARNAFKKAIYKLPCTTKFISKEDMFDFTIE